MARYDARAELAPRDVVARSILHEMQRTGSANVWLDATAFGPGEFAQRFPTIDSYCKSQGCDPARDPIPVAPAAHYMMGGVWTDSWGRTTVPGLYACGETASTGVHGANRLASNSLLEGVVFGSRVAQCVTDPTCVMRGLDNVAIGRGLRYPGPAPMDSRPLQLTHRAGVLLPVRETLQTLLWERVGIERTGAGLEAACDQLAAWATATPLESVESLETWNLALVGWVMAQAAWSREESRGAHWRDDFPLPRDEWRVRQAFTVSVAPLPGRQVRTASGAGLRA
jgi:L-aspartate oxidase